MYIFLSLTLARLRDTVVGQSISPGFSNHTCVSMMEFLVADDEGGWGDGGHRRRGEIVFFWRRGNIYYLTACGGEYSTLLLEKQEE